LLVSGILVVTHNLHWSAIQKQDKFQKRAKNGEKFRKYRAQIGIERVRKLNAKKWSKSASTQKWSSPRYLAGQTAFSGKKYFPVKTRGEKSIYPKYSRDETGIEGYEIRVLVRRVIVQ
jgi:hypothetical protein